VVAEEGDYCDKCVVALAEYNQVYNYLYTLTIAREKVEDMCRQLRKKGRFCLGDFCGFDALAVIRRLIQYFETEELDQLIARLISIVDRKDLGDGSPGVPVVLQEPGDGSPGGSGDPQGPRDGSPVEPVDGGTFCCIVKLQPCHMLLLAFWSSL
jgi:hypothetical protein